MKKKTILGQFNTTNKDYILSGMEDFVCGKVWVDPYAGNGDLLDWALLHGATDTKGFDVDKTKVSERIQHRDTLLDPPDFADYYVIANPPYLARNKNQDKTLYDKYGQDDLYKIAILTICENNCKGGILIVPLNFLSSVYANSIRDLFFSKYKILNCKIFEETVFEDTDYTVCAFSFEKRESICDKDVLNVIFCPSKKTMQFEISQNYHWIVGEEFYQYIEGVDHKGIGRWTVKNGTTGYTHKTVEEGEAKNATRATVYINSLDEVPTKKGGDTNDCIVNGPKPNTYFCKDALKDIILIRAIDTGTMDGRIELCNIRSLVKGNKKPVLLGLETSRNLAHVRFAEGRPSEEEQLKIIEMVNAKLETFRSDYNSVFLTAFRNSTKSYSRKRISFDVVYKMIAKALSEIRT